MIEISTAEVERFRTTPRHLELVRSGAVVRLGEISTAGRPAYAVEGRLVRIEYREGAWQTEDHSLIHDALAAVEAELVRLFSLGAQAGYHAAKREAVR